MAEQMSVVQSLFGLTPTNVQRQIDAESDRKAMEVAMLSRSPTSVSEYYGLRGAERFRNAPVFGENPRVAQATQIQTVVQSLEQQGIDMATPEGMTQLAGELNKNPEFAGIALSLRQEAARLQDAKRKTAFAEAKTASEIAENIAQADKARMEKVPGATEQAERDKLAQLRAKFPDTPEGRAQAAQEFAEWKSSFKQKEAASGAAKMVMEGQKRVLNIDEKDAEAYNLSKQSAAKALPILNRMKTEVEKGIIVGSLPDARLGFLKALDTLGVSTAEARKTVANTEQFNNQVRLLLQSIIKQFGYNPSNADVKFALESLPNNSNSPEGLKAIIDALIRANQTQLTESTRAIKHYRENNGSFAGFVPNYDAVFPSAAKAPADMTDAELREAIAAQKAKQVK